MILESNGPTKAIHFEATEKDPRFVAAYEAALASGDAFEATLQALGNLPIAAGDRVLESLRRISLYVGTLFQEAHAASTQLSFMEMPRAQYILNRQLIEYFSRNRWFLENKESAVRDLDLLPKTVHKEVERNPGAFDAEFTRDIAHNYATWAKENPELDQIRHDIPGPTGLVKLALDEPEELFWYYGRPSIIVHGKTHGIQDVLIKRADGSLERSPNSPQIDRIKEMHRATGFAIQYGFLLAVNFGLDQSTLAAAQSTFDITLREEGVTPRVIAVKRYLS